MKHIVVIVAGGVGKRMKSVKPKQFLTIGNYNILQHTINAFKHVADNILLVLPESEISTWKEICATAEVNINYPIISGGKERFFSVKNAVDYIFDHHELNDAIISIHDGVRPLVNQQTIHNTYQLAIEKQAAIPVIDLKDSLRKVQDNQSEHVDRTMFKSVQTPQSFQAEILYQAYQQAFSPLFTDDASVVENIGFPIALSQGNEENIKITTPLDLSLASLLIKP
jgi:2-C-methyl-D-erythritol 4-phosphate cytidylyltransferase